MIELIGPPRTSPGNEMSGLAGLLGPSPSCGPPLSSPPTLPDLSRVFLISSPIPGRVTSVAS